MDKIKFQRFIDGFEKSKIEFSYVQLVSEYDTEKNCGSVCCAIGTLPEIFPDVFIWEFVEEDKRYKVRAKDRFYLRSSLMDFFELSYEEEKIFRNIFYHINEFSEFISLNYIAKEDVLNLMKKFIKGELND